MRYKVIPGQRSGQSENESPKLIFNGTTGIAESYYKQFSGLALAIRQLKSLRTVLAQSNNEGPINLRLGAIIFDVMQDIIISLGEIVSYREFLSKNNANLSIADRDGVPELDKIVTDLNEFVPSYGRPENDISFIAGKIHKAIEIIFGEDQKVAPLKDALSRIQI